MKLKNIGSIAPTKSLARMLLLAMLVAVLWLLSGQSGPAPVSAAGADAVTTGGQHTCAVTTTNALKCWGWNAFGQLGDGTTTNRLTPVSVSGLTSGVAAVAGGAGHTCAVTTAGAVKCWGDNDNGRLGDGTTTDRLTPVAVSGLGSGFAAISLGEAFSCALSTSGAVACWGFNNVGQLGDGTNTTRLTAVTVSGLSSGVAAITAGHRQACALTTAGGVKCWGLNDNGQLGDGTTTNNAIPQNVSGLTSGVAAIAAGSAHTCAVTTSGGLKCWGDNSAGQLGDGTTIDRTAPVDVSGLTSGVAVVAAGSNHTCAVTTAGGVKCWGDNTVGQLGDGTNTNRTTPVDVSGLSSGIVAIAGAHWGTTPPNTCALSTVGALKCWGSNNVGQVGDGTTTNRNTPVDVDVLGPVPGTGVPTLINYQGLLTDPGTGDPVADGDYAVTFRIFDDATAGTTLWSEVQSVTVTDGLFNVLLGSAKFIPASIFSGTERYLEVQVESDPAMTPRQRLVSVPYAMQADRLLGPTGETIAWGGQGNLGFLDRFAVSSSLSVGGNVNVGAALGLNGADFFVNQDGPDGDSGILFYDGGSPTGEALRWNDANDRFEFSNDLHVIGTVTSTSDRNAKANFQSVDSQELLDRLASVPIDTWTFKDDESGARHIGPTAQDFNAAFSVGADDTSISLTDANGVALVAIQGLYEELRERDARIDALEERLTALEGGGGAPQAGTASSGEGASWLPIVLPLLALFAIPVAGLLGGWAGRRARS